MGGVRDPRRAVPTVLRSKAVESVLGMGAAVVHSVPRMDGAKESRALEKGRERKSRVWEMDRAKQSKASGMGKARDCKVPDMGRARACKVWEMGEGWIRELGVGRGLLWEGRRRGQGWWEEQLVCTS